jgi:hypothetical protein
MGVSDDLDAVSQDVWQRVFFVLGDDDNDPDRHVGALGIDGAEGALELFGAIAQCG